MACVAGGLKTGAGVGVAAMCAQRMFILTCCFYYYASAKQSWGRKILYTNMTVDEISFQFRLIPVKDTLHSSLGKHHVRQSSYVLHLLSTDKRITTGFEVCGAS